MHHWGDENVPWKDIDDAANYISDYCRKYALLTGPSKEKFGTVRFYANFSELSLHAFIYPGYIYRQFPNWLWWIDDKIISPVLNFLFGRIFFKWQKYIYRRAYANSLKKWPHIREEILCCADHDDFLEGL